MTESDWLTSADPAAMLSALNFSKDSLQGKLNPPSDRKLRLFAVACCRQVWGRLVDEAPCGRCNGRGTIPDIGMSDALDEFVDTSCPDCGGTGRVNRSRRAVEVAERFADGAATVWELATAYQDASAGWPGGIDDVAAARRAAAWSCADRSSFGQQQPWEVFASEGWPIPPATQADLLRCIVGNPFRPVMVREPLRCSNGHAGFVFVRKNSLPAPVSICEVCREDGPWWDDVVKGKPPSWLTPTGLSLAAGIYDDRAFDRLPILADALEEAGCTDADILAHCRGPGPHVRGCWALDLVLGGERL